MRNFCSIITNGRDAILTWNGTNHILQNLKKTTFWALKAKSWAPQMQYLKRAWINESQDGTVLGIICWSVGKYGLHQEAQEILPSSQRCCCAGDAIAGHEGIICASGKLQAGFR